ncbi:MAG: cytochrome P450 [Flammeovirgaceae bacterium]
MSNYRYPKGITPLQLFTRSLRLLRYPIHTISDNMKHFGGTYAAPMGKHKIIVTQDPEFIDYILRKNHKNYDKSKILTSTLAKYIGHGLLTATGSHWLKQRKLIQPGFHIRKIKALYQIVQDTVDRSLTNFPTGSEIDIYPLMNQLAFDIVINSLFNVSIPKEKMRELGEFISDIQGFVVKEVRVPFFTWWSRILGTNKKYLKQAQASREIIRTIIRARKESQETHNDLLDMLLSIRYEDTGQGMDEEQLIDEILILVVAGHETTANALSWTLYLLANHPDKLIKLQQETADLSIEETVKHPYLNAVIKESMRRYPPAWISDRVALTDDTFKEYSYEKGTMIAPFFYGVHHDANLWTNPEDFDPERFMPAREKEMNSIAYHPFGAGPRSCIGNHFAMAEMALFLKTFIQQFDITATEQEPMMIALITLRPDRVLLKVKTRCSLPDGFARL